MSEEFIFKPANKQQNKLRLGIAGPSGSGKTLSALFIAQGLGGKIGVIDTERESASLYSDSVKFESLCLNPPYSPERFIAALHAAEQLFDVIILDSCTHEWDGSGGCLEINENLAQGKYRGNTWAAFNEVTPRHRFFLDAINQSPRHLICTCRSKTETVQTEDKKVKKLGMKVQQREGFEYEMTVMLECDHSSHKAIMTKGRLYSAPDSIKNRFSEPHIITPEDGKALLAWLNTGAIPEIQRRPQETHKPTQTMTDGSGYSCPAEPPEKIPFSELLALGQAACSEYMRNISTPEKKVDAIAVRQKFLPKFSSLRAALEAGEEVNIFIAMKEEYQKVGLAEYPALEKLLDKIIPF